MKKVLALAAAAALAAGASAFAANPFSDVSTSDWAYQAVSDLSDQGIVEGYPDGTFKGETNITRYELAQIVARLMAKEDQYSAEQRATIDKLAGEYADELASLGVRVSNLEKKVGNLSWSGDARMRYQDKGAKDDWNGRVRIAVKGQVNENTTVVGRLSTHMNFKSDSGNTNTHMDQLYVNHKFGDAVAVRLGRFPVAFGDQGGWLFNTLDGLDGAEVSAYLAKGVKVAVGYGQLNFNHELAASAGAKAYGVAGVIDQDDDLLYVKANADLKVAKLGVDYLAVKEYDNDTELYGVNLAVPVGEFRVFGDYWKNTTTSSKYDEAWNAGVAYGKLNLKKPGSFDVSVAYNDVDSKVYFGGTGLQTTALKYVEGNDTNVTFWNALANVTLQKNVFLHAEYAFDVDAENAKNEKDSWTVSLNYVF